MGPSTAAAGRSDAIDQVVLEQPERPPAPSTAARSSASVAREQPRIDADALTLLQVLRQPGGQGRHALDPLLEQLDAAPLELRSACRKYRPSVQSPAPSSVTSRSPADPEKPLSQGRRSQQAAVLALVGSCSAPDTPTRPSSASALAAVEASSVRSFDPDPSEPRVDLDPGHTSRSFGLMYTARSMSRSVVTNSISLVSGAQWCVACGRSPCHSGPARRPRRCHARRGAHRVGDQHLGVLRRAVCLRAQHVVEELQPSRAAGRRNHAPGDAVGTPSLNGRRARAPAPARSSASGPRRGPRRRA